MWPTKQASKEASKQGSERASEQTSRQTNKTKQRSTSLSQSPPPTHVCTFDRVEDTDAARSTRESEEAMIRDLKWLGLDWDEGPDVGGPHAPYRQSERRDIYKKYVDQLVAQDKAYPCFCTDEELEA
eukprot:365971-Chlamydomonas_euryale.AAC.5